MIYQVAFASTDGKVVNQHFGRASAFHIVKINEEENAADYIEARHCEPACQDFSHSEAHLREVAALLKDCRAVFVARIGTGAQIALKSYGIQGIEMPYLIEDVLDVLLHSKVKVIQDLTL